MIEFIKETDSLKERVKRLENVVVFLMEKTGYAAELDAIEGDKRSSSSITVTMCDGRGET